MSGHFRASKRSPLKKRHIMLMILILLTLISVQGFLYVERNLEPALKEIAKTYVKQIATNTIADAISKKISEDMQENHNVAIIKTDESGKITLISFDQSTQARIITQVTYRANQSLMELSKEPISIPIGLALNSNILAQLGPNVPITLVPMGAAKADIEVRLKEAGINVVSIEVYLKIEADVRIVIPFSSDEAIVTTEFPIEVHVLPGEVPNVYFQSADGSLSPVPNISLPIDENM
jgi:sporulation protein YunB